MIREHLLVPAVPDLERPAGFYREVLGFTVHEMGAPPRWRTFMRCLGCSPKA